MRDLLLNRIPAVLTANIYATAAIAGALAVGIALRLKTPPLVAMTIGFLICFGLRVLAVVFDWQLPSLR